MSAPAVSVVITCYNYGRYLERCLNSVTAQTLQDLEIVVVDDGSTDGTEATMRPYLRLPNLKYIRQENRGQARAKNVGIRHSSGAYVAFLDADDAWCPEKLAKQIPRFKRKETGVVFCRARYLDRNGDAMEYEMTAPFLQPRRGRVTKWLFYDNFVQFSSTVVRRECFDRFGVFDERLKMGIDWDLWLRISTEYEFDYVDERLFYYRMGHAGQMSRNMEERHSCSDRIVQRFLGSYPGLIPASVVRKAGAMTCCNRGEYFRDIDRRKSTGYYLEAIRKNPLMAAPYKGLIKNMLAGS